MNVLLYQPLLQGSCLKLPTLTPPVSIQIVLPALGCSKMFLADMTAEHMPWGTMLTYTGVPLQGVEPRTVRGLDNQVDNHGIATYSLNPYQ